jgi:hypothetical protein
MTILVDGGKKMIRNKNVFKEKKVKYRKRPVVVEAIQWTGKNLSEIETLGGTRKITVDPKNKLLIKTMEGVMTANIKDWIIKGVKGELYPCKPDIFKSTYELVDETIRPLREGSVRKGGINPIKNTPRPKIAPRPQGVRPRAR